MPTSSSINTASRNLKPNYVEIKYQVCLYEYDVPNRRPKYKG